MSKLVEKLMHTNDIFYKDVKIAITGNKDIYIENYRGIIEYTDISIILQTKTGILKITGNGLQIAFYTNEDMKIKGYIKTIEFDKEQRP